MPSIIEGYNYDIFISYRQKDNKHDGWVTEFVNQLKGELEATFKEDISIYFDENPHDGLLETHNVDKSLEDKLRCLIFIPIISQTYCDPKSYAWQYEFCTFNKLANEDSFGRDIKLTSGNVASRILPVKIHDLDPEDQTLLENELGGVLRAIEFIYKSAGVNRPLRSTEEKPQENLNNTLYRDQINKVANAIKEIITALKKQSQHPEEISREEANKVSIHSKNHTTTIIAVSIITLALIILGFLFVPKLFKPSEELEKSIAVLPFINDSPDQERMYFINGTMEAILDNLCKIKDLRVPGRTSVEQYRDNIKPIPTIAKELNVSYILEGSGHRDGNKVRLFIQLLDGKKDQHLWSKSYDADIEDIFSMQSEIAKLIAKEIDAIITPEEKQIIEKIPTTNLTAYDFYQRGKDEYSDYLLNDTNKDALNRAEDFYHKALKYDPTYAQAFTGLAMVFWEKHFDVDYYSFSKGFMDSVLILSNIALSYDKNLAEAYSLKGDVFRVNGKYEEAIDEYNDALRINPNYWQAYVGLSGLYFSQKRDFFKTTECLAAALRLNHDPILRPIIIWNIGLALDHMGFFIESEYYYKEFLKLSNDSARYYNQIAWSKNRQENYSEAIKLMKECQRLDPKRNEYGNIGDFYLKLGLRDSAVENYKKFFLKIDTIQIKGVNDRHRIGYRYLMTGHPREAEFYFDLQKKYCDESIEFNREYGQGSTAYYDLAGIYAIRGDKENAYKNLHLYNEKIGDSEIRSMVWFLKTDPFFDSIRSEPEFQAIYNEIETKYNNTHERLRKWLEEQGELY